MKIFNRIEEERVIVKLGLGWGVREVVNFGTSIVREDSESETFRTRIPGNFWEGDSETER